MMGINIDRVIVFTFVLGSALAGAAGVMFALRVPDGRLDRLPRRPQGLHRRRDRRHRLDPRRDGRRPDPRARRGLHRRLLDDALVGPRDLLGPDRLHAVPPERPVRPGGHQQGMSEPAAHRSRRPAVRPRDRAGRVGRAPRRAPLAAGRLDRRGRGAPAATPRGGRWLVLFVAAFAAAAGRLRQRLHPPRRVRHGALHAARARPQRRRRLGRAARPRLRRVLRHRRLRLRDARARDQLGVHLPTLVVDPARGASSARRAASSSGCRRDA